MLVIHLAVCLQIRNVVLPSHLLIEFLCQIGREGAFRKILIRLSIFRLLAAQRTTGTINMLH